jgi:hypothetical protein
MAAKDRLHRYEFMDLDAAPDAPDDPLAEPAAPSDRGAGPIGFAGAAPKSELSLAAGLITLDRDDLGGGPIRPMLPSSWGRDSNAGS